MPHLISRPCAVTEWVTTLQGKAAMTTVLGIFDEYETERKRKLGEMENPPALPGLNGVQPDPSYCLMTMKLCEARLAELAAHTWQDPKVWYDGNVDSAPEPCYRSLARKGTEGSAGAFDLDLLQMSLGGGVMSTGVTYHETPPYLDKQYRTYGGHYKYLYEPYTGGLVDHGPVAKPTEEEYRLWKVRDTALQTEKARVKAMHASALHSIIQHYGKSLTTDSDRIWRRFEEPEDGEY